MTDSTSTPDRTDRHPTRRRFLQTAVATGAGLAALSSGSQRASARTEYRTSYLRMLGTDDEQRIHYYRAPRDGPTTLIVGGIHGDEKAGYLAADEISEWSVDRGELVVIPRAHPSAIAADHRPWSNDLNRQFPPTGGECSTELARVLWSVVEHHDPDLVLDLHSSRGIYKSGDGGVGQAMFPTWTSPARSMGEKTVAALNDRFGLSGDMAYRMGNTLDADRDMLMHRVAGVLDRPGFICETTEKAPLDDQLAWHLFTVEHVLAQFGQKRATASYDRPSVEARTVTLDDPWQSYSLSGSYDDPAVFMPAISNQGPQPCHTRVRNVSSSGYEAKVEEWLYQNGVHYSETAGMLAVESGVYQLDCGSLEVGTCTTNHDFTGIGFDADFSSRPVVLVQSQTEVGTDPIVPRLQNVSTGGMAVLVQEEDGEENGGYHYEEEVAYLAVEPGTGTLSGRPFEAGTTTADHEWTKISFDQTYDDPTFLASTQTYTGWNTVTVRYRNLTGSSVEIMLQEEQSADLEMSHDPERVGYLVVES